MNCELNDEFCLRKHLFHTSKDSLTCCKILRHGADGFAFHPKEGVLRIFIALKNPSLSARFVSAKLGSNDMNANHYTTEDDMMVMIMMM
jgi:hypothetical protein